MPKGKKADNPPSAPNEPEPQPSVAEVQAQAGIEGIFSGGQVEDETGENPEETPPAVETETAPEVPGKAEEGEKPTGEGEPSEDWWKQYGGTKKEALKSLGLVDAGEHQNLQELFGKQTKEIGEGRQLQERINAIIAANQPQTQEPDNEGFMDQFAEKPLDAIQQLIRNELAGVAQIGQRTQDFLNAYYRKNPDMQKFQNQAQGLARELGIDLSILPNYPGPGEQMLVRLHGLVKSQAIANDLPKIREAVMRDVLNSDKEKGGAQLESSGKSPPAKVEKTLADEAKQDILDIAKEDEAITHLDIKFGD